VSVIVLVLLGAAGGCTTSLHDWVRNGFKVGPNYARPPAPVADAWIDDGNEKIQATGTHYADWWAAFNDPTLDSLVWQAYDENLPLKVAGLRVLEARAQLAVATGNLLPQQQQAIGAFARSKISENGYPFGSFSLPKTAFDTWNLGFDVAWEFDFWGRFRRMIESADAAMNAQIENYDDVLVLLQAEVATTYVQLRTLEERLDLATRNVELLKETLRIVRARFAAGEVDDLDVQQTLTILSATEAAIPVFRKGRRQAQNRLCTLRGMPPQALDEQLGESGVIPQAPASIVLGIPAELLRRRPDIRRAEREAAAQCAQIGVAESELYPRIAFTGTIAVESETFSRLFNAGSSKFVLGPGFQWNVLNYGRIRGNVRAQDARFQQLVLEYQETVLRANEEVENAVTAFLNEQDRVQSLTVAAEAAAKSVKLSQLQYERGLVDFERLLDSQRALILQQDALAEATGNVALQLVAAYKALGGGWQARFAEPTN